MGTRAISLALTLALATAVGCNSWPKVREEVVEPIHHRLHHELPELLEHGDRAGLDALFASEADASERAPIHEVADAFREVADARLHILRVDLEATPVRAEALLQVHGVRQGGEFASLSQDKHWLLAREPDGWRILADRPTPIRWAPRPAAHFFDETTLRGIWFQHQSGRVRDAKGELQRHVFGSGVAVADLDNDGWEDALLLTDERIDLFRNHQGSFERVSEARGLGEQDGRLLTVLLPVDLDNDGWKDLFVGAEYGQPLLFRNREGRFERVEDHGLHTTERTISAVAADFDADGLVDLYLANHENVFIESPEPPGGADNAEGDQLFLNRGDLRFSDETRAAGIDNTGWTLTPVAADYDLDGDVDLFVGNDFGTDRLYRNDGAGHFEEVSVAAGVDKPVASMGADWGDYDGDGDFDLFIGGMFSGSGWVLEAPEFQIRRVPRLVDWLFRPYVREAVRSWFRGNRLYENLGNGSFREVAAGSGAGNSGWSWATVWLDFDNDGRLDLYGLNGFISGKLEDDL